jgi:hypothetical protein
MMNATWRGTGPARSTAAAARRSAPPTPPTELRRVAPAAATGGACGASAEAANDMAQGARRMWRC